MRQKRVYLCSRVAKDARDLNMQVANALYDAGYSVYVPHLAKINNESGATDEEIYNQDIAELNASDLLVAVGRLGIDCATEVGIAQGAGKPSFWYLPTGVEVPWTPMLHGLKSRHKHQTIEALLADIQERFSTY